MRNPASALIVLLLFLCPRAHGSEPEYDESLELFPGPVDQKYLVEAKRVVFLVPHDNPGYKLHEPHTWLRPTDEDLQRLAAAPKLEGLDLEGGLVTAAGVKTLSALPQLSRLRIRRAAHGDDIIKELSRSKSLRKLDLRHSEVTNRSAKFLAEMKGLKDLSLRGSQVDDGFVEEHQLPDNLERLNLSDTSVGLRVISRLPKSLKYLDVDGPNIDMRCFREFKNLPNLRTLDASFTDARTRDLEHLRHLLPKVKVNGQEPVQPANEARQE